MTHACEAEVKKALTLPAKDEPKKKRKQSIITDFFIKNKVYKQRKYVKNGLYL